MTMLAQDYLEAPDPTFRKGISGQLLCSGFDYVGYKQPAFMNLAKGWPR
jgi:hypothetical protein